MVKTIIIAVLAAACVWLAAMTICYRWQVHYAMDALRDEDALRAALRQSLLNCSHDTDTSVNCHDKTPMN